MSSTNRTEVLEKKISDIIKEEHSKINLQIPFRTDIRSEIKPYALSVSDFVNSEINISISFYNSPGCSGTQKLSK